MLPRSARQYSCITIDPKAYNRRQQSSSPQKGFCCLSAIRPPSKRSSSSAKTGFQAQQHFKGQDHCGEDPISTSEKLFCWLAVILHTFKQPEMSPDSVFKPSPLCNVQSRTDTDDGSPFCCQREEGVSPGGFGGRLGEGDELKKRNDIPRSHISNICFNPNHWSLLQQSNPTRKLSPLYLTLEY